MYTMEIGSKSLKANASSSSLSFLYQSKKHRGLMPGICKESPSINRCPTSISPSDIVHSVSYSPKVHPNLSLICSLEIVEVAVARGCEYRKDRTHHLSKNEEEGLLERLDMPRAGPASTSSSTAPTAGQAGDDDVEETCNGTDDGL